MYVGTFLGGSQRFFSMFFFSVSLHFLRLNNRNLHTNVTTYLQSSVYLFTSKYMYISQLQVPSHVSRLSNKCLGSSLGETWNTYILILVFIHPRSFKFVIYTHLEYIYPFVLRFIPLDWLGYHNGWFGCSSCCREPWRASVRVGVFACGCCLVSLSYPML